MSPVAVRGALAVVGLAAAGGLALLARSMRHGPPLTVYGHVPPFRLVDERGGAFTQESLFGHVSVVDFVFTHCTSSCPQLTARMGELQARLAREGGSARLVSFSVDPENDTPEVLSRYAANAHADPARWSFVTGPAEEVQKAVVAGFKVAAGRASPGARETEVTHGEWFVLVDRRGDLRGYYPTGTAEELDAVARDMTRLEHEAP
jgi:protein SCO1/2